MTMVKVVNNRAPWKPVKKGLEEGSNKVIVMQRLDEGHIGETVKLNLNSLQKNRDYIASICTEGWVLNVSLRTTNNKIHVDKYGQFFVINKAKGETVKDEKGQLPGQVEMFDEQAKEN